MRSWAFLLTRRWIVFALVVTLLAYLAWWLGEWQFRRLDDRHRRNAVFERNVSADPVPVTEVLTRTSEVAAGNEWRRVSARGSYDVARTVVVRYQTREGSSGLDVVVPFRVETGAVVLVDRGWLRSANNASPDTDLPAPPSSMGTSRPVTLTGWVRRNATGDSTRVVAAADGRLPSTRAISSVTIGAATRVELLRGFVVLESERPAARTPLSAAELPEVGNGPHFFYGLQWWFFALLALGGFSYLAYDEHRRSQAQQPARARTTA
ncbi:MAG: SURF1 family cytochrome oxidase biogenesis protein [Nocardioides sp.]